MKFSCEKYLLQAACSIASRAAASKSPIPALEGLQISCEDKLTIKGYDLKKAIVTSLEADIVQRGTVVVGARLFGEMIRRLPDGIVTVSSDEKDNISPLRRGQLHLPASERAQGYDQQDHLRRLHG